MAMKVINIQPKDIYITFEIGLKEADSLLDALDMAEVKFDGKDESQMFAKDALNKFFETLSEVVEDLKKA